MADLEKKIIISGAAGTGKSTLIEELRMSGFPCIDEVSRVIIDEQLHKGGDKLPWKNVKAFSDRCIEETLKGLKENSNVAFCDRGLLDYQVYSMVQDADIEPIIDVEYLHKMYHSTVFYCPIWKEIYKQEPQRPEPFEHQVIVDAISRSIYLNAGFELIEIPKVIVQERCLFLEEKTKELGINI